MPIFTVDATKCRKDGICAFICPVKVITGEPGELPSLRTKGDHNCIGCGQCVAFCPHDACELKDFGDPLPLDAQLPEPEAALNLIKSRRSIRAYKDKQVDKGELGRIFDATNYAPTAVNMHESRLVVIYERKRLIEIGDMLAQAFLDFAEENAKASYAPMAKALARSWHKGTDVFFRGAPHLVAVIAPPVEKAPWGLVDGVIALTYIELSAAAVGIGACWAGYLTRQVGGSAALREAFGLAPGEVFAGAQMLGYPKYKAKKLPFRPALPVTWR